MIWINQIVFWIPLIFSVGVLLYLFRQIILKKALQVKTLRTLTLLVILILIVQLLARIFIFYWQLKNSSLGPYLLPSKGSTFFINTIWPAFLEPLVITAIMALILVAIIFLTRRWVKKPLFEDSDWLVIVLTIFSTGFPNFFVLIFGALFLMIIFQIFQRVVFKRALNERLKIAPFFLFSALIIAVLTNFTFYMSFLNLIGLSSLF